MSRLRSDGEAGPLRGLVALRDEEKLPLFLLFLCYSSYFFLLMLLPHLPDGVSLRDKWLLFVSGWLLVSPLGLASTIALVKAKGVVAARTSTFYPMMVVANTYTLLMAIVVLRLLDSALQAPMQGVLAAMAAIALLFPLMNILVLRSHGWIRDWLLPGDSKGFFVKYAYASVPGVAAAGVLAFTPLQAASFYLSLSVLVVTLFLLSRVRAPSRRDVGGGWRLLDGLLVMATALLVLDLGFHFEWHHHNFYLGPTMDLIGGRSLLVDINSQYGVFVIYFLAGVFQSGILPLSYQGLALLISVLLVGQYAIVYALLRCVLRSVGYSAIAVGMVLILNLFAPLDYSTWYPSSGPLRYGLAYLVLLAVALRLRYPSRRGWSLLLECGVVGIASIWSFETLLAVLAVYVAAIAYEAAWSSPRPSDIPRAIWRRSRWALLGIVVAHLLLALDIHGRSGEWPRWDVYFEYLGVYGLEGLALVEMQVWSPWAVVVAVQFASMTACIFELVDLKKRDRMPELTIVFAMTALGIAQFTYYLVRPHPSSLLVVITPAVFVAAYWVVRASRIRGGAHCGFWSSLTYCGYGAALLLVVLFAPRVVEKADSSALAFLARAAGQYARGEATGVGWVMGTLAPSARTLVESSEAHLAAEAVYLVDKHAADRPRIALFIHSDLATEVLMLTRKTHLFPLSNVRQDQLTSTGRTRALGFQHGLKAGDTLFLEKDPERLAPLQLDIIARLRAEFDFQEMEITEHGIVAARLHPRGSLSDEKASSP